MPKIVTIKQNHEFRRLYRRASKVSPVLVTYCAKNRLGYNRIGITTGKKVGNAVKRNRARRIIKEAYRLVSPSLTTKCGWDIVFVARTRTAFSNTQEVALHMRSHLTSFLSNA